MIQPSPFELLETFYPDGLPPGQLPLYTTTRRAANQRTYWCYNLRQADRRCAKYRNTRRVLFGPALHDVQAALAIAKERRGAAVPETIRGADDSVIALPALWAVVPFGAPPLPPTLRQALALFEAARHRPSIAIAGDDEVVAIWLLKHLWRFDLAAEPTAERAKARELMRRIHWAIRADADARGQRLPGGAGGAGVLAAAFPLPDAPTGAGAKGSKSRLVTFPLIAGGDRYRRRDFESLPEPPATATAPRPWLAVLEPPPAARPAARVYPFAPIVRACSWLRHCHTDRATLDKRELEHASRLLLRCEAPGADRVGLVHELHAGHPAYDPADVDASIAAGLRAPGRPVTCRRIAATPGVHERHCATCPRFGKIEGPLDLAREAHDDDDGGGTREDTPGAPDRTDGGSSAPAAPPAPRIPIHDPQHEVNDRALAALATAGALFEQDGRLVEILGAPAARLGDPPAVRQVSEPRLRELLSRHCAFVAETGGQPVPAHPPQWTTRALLARGSWPELPRLERPALTGAVAADPVAAGGVAKGATAASEAGAADLLAGIESLLESLGGSATARRMVAALAAEPERYPELAASLPHWIPDLDPAEPGAAAALGLCLRRLKGRASGGRILDEERRTRDGIDWAVRRIPQSPPIHEPRKEQTPS